MAQRVTDRVQGGAQALWGRLLHFLREVRGEFNKINWPSRAELIALTILVVMMVVALTVYIGALDVGFRRLVEWLIKVPK